MAPPTSAMPQKDLKPIQTFYCTYLLRSTVSSKSLYIGSTPHPRRRLAQHNGENRGGAKRTSQSKYQPWEMVCIVAGFPSSLAALQFEWAWQHPHISNKIPAALRLAATKRKTHSGRTKLYAPSSVTARLQSLHLLLRVSAFSRWPLSVRFFAADVYHMWELWCQRESSPLRKSIPVTLDVRQREGTAPPKRQWAANGVGGLQALDISGGGLERHLEKARALLEQEAGRACKVCEGELRAEVAVVCPHVGCDHVAHVACLAEEFLGQEERPAADGGVPVLPVGGACPGCGGVAPWADLVKELSVRTRSKAKLKKATKKGAAAAEEDEEEEEEEEDLMEVEMSELEDEETDTDSAMSDEPAESSSKKKKRVRATKKTDKGKRNKRLPSVIEDSDDPLSDLVSEAESEEKVKKTGKGRKTARTKKAAAAGSDASDPAAAEGESVAKKKKRTTKKALQTVAEESGSDSVQEESKPVKKARGRPKKVAAEDNDLELVEKPKKPRGRPKKALQTAVDGLGEIDAGKVKRGRKPKAPPAAATVATDSDWDGVETIG